MLKVESVDTMLSGLQFMLTWKMTQSRNASHTHNQPAHFVSFPFQICNFLILIVICLFSPFFPAQPYRSICLIMWIVCSFEKLWFVLCHSRMCVLMLMRTCMPSLVSPFNYAIKIIAYFFMYFRLNSNRIHCVKFIRLCCIFSHFCFPLPRSICMIKGMNTLDRTEYAASFSFLHTHVRYRYMRRYIDIAAITWQQSMSECRMNYIVKSKINKWHEW